MAHKGHPSSQSQTLLSFTGAASLFTQEHYVSSNTVVCHWWPPCQDHPILLASERSPILSKIKIHWRESSLQYTLHLIIQNTA